MAKTVCEHPDKESYAFIDFINTKQVDNVAYKKWMKDKMMLSINNMVMSELEELYDNWIHYE
jgi:hypothetical protein